jgi:acyl-CoA hydrolase
MKMTTYTTYHLVKGDSLNHHGTLFAGRAAEWFVESGFIAAGMLTKPENIVCVKIHGMTFTRPVPLGAVARFDSRVVLTGKSRIVVNITLTNHDEPVVNGFITFVNVDQNTKALPHGITIEATTEEEKAIQEIAKNLK